MTDPVGDPPCDHDSLTPCPPECRDAKEQWRRDAVRELNAEAGHRDLSKTAADLRYHAPDVLQGGQVLERAADQIEAMAAVGVRQERHIESLREDNAVLRNRVEDLTREVKELRSQNSGLRSQMQQTERPNMRISYRGFNYGVGSQWGVESLRDAIRKNGHD